MFCAVMWNIVTVLCSCFMLFYSCFMCTILYVHGDCFMFLLYAPAQNLSYEWLSTFPSVGLENMQIRHSSWMPALYVRILHKFWLYLVWFNVVILCFRFPLKMATFWKRTQIKQYNLKGGGGGQSITIYNGSLSKGGRSVGITYNIHLKGQTYLISGHDGKL